MPKKKYYRVGERPPPRGSLSEGFWQPPPRPAPEPEPEPKPPPRRRARRRSLRPNPPEAP